MRYEGIANDGQGVRKKNEREAATLSVWCAGLHVLDSIIRARVSCCMAARGGVCAVKGV